MSLLDSHIYQLSIYLTETNNNLRSLYLDGNNLITDDSLTRLAEALSKNTKLAHLSFKDCALLTNDGLRHLNEILRMNNTIIQSIEFTETNFDQALGNSVKLETLLNKAI
jgi:hypothetical protein